jgi:hypothetical protein
MCGYVGPMIWLLHNGTEIQLFEPLSSIFTDMEYVRIRYGNCRFIITAKSVDDCDFAIRCDYRAMVAWDVGAAYVEEQVKRSKDVDSGAGNLSAEAVARMQARWDTFTSGDGERRR